MSIFKPPGALRSDPKQRGTLRSPRPKPSSRPGVERPSSPQANAPTGWFNPAEWKWRWKQLEEEPVLGPEVSTQAGAGRLAQRPEVTGETGLAARRPQRKTDPRHGDSSKGCGKPGMVVLTCHPSTQRGG